MKPEDDNTQSFVALTRGTMVSHYKIISKIGAGGMGEVHLAEDTELKRKVALKFLPPHLCQDEDCRKRFKREAQAAAGLDHPNIVPVYEVGDFSGRPFFSMAHIGGQSLREVIKQGKLIVNEVIDLAMQVCEGLHEAHGAGVVHRDIKPGNIIIDEKGKPRLLDFGLATVAGEEKLTRTGSTLGTVGYMAPEQVEGKKVDHRADLFSWGVVLYEMLTGRRPFEGENDAAVVNAITNSTPEPIARFKSGTSAELQSIIDKALAKDPSLRYQHADDMKTDLHRLEAGYEPTGAKSRRRLVFSVAGISLITIAAMFFYSLYGEFRTEADPEYRQRQITFHGDIYSFDLSPDGRYLAYTRGEMYNVKNSDPMCAYVRDLEGGEPILIHQDKWVTDVNWSLDGTELLVRADNDSIGGFYLYPRLGGSARRYQIGKSSTWWQVTWAPDGSGFAISYDIIPDDVFFVDLQSGDIRTVKAQGNFDWIYNISWSPAGDFLLMRTGDGDGFKYWTMAIQDGAMTRIEADSMRFPRWGKDGRSIVFQSWSDRMCRLMEVPVEPQTGTPVGEPITIVDDLEAYQGIDSKGIASSRDYSRVAFVRKVSWCNLWMAELGLSQKTGEVAKYAITEGTAYQHSPVFSPDGRTIAFVKSVDGRGRVHLLELETNEVRQLTFTGRGDFGPVWSPDGRRLAYAMTDDNGGHVAIISVSGGTPDVYDSTLVSLEWKDWQPLAWEPGQFILYRETGDKITKQLDPVKRISVPIIPEDSTFLKYGAIYSPSGNEIALFWNRSARVSEYKDQNESDRATWIISVRDSTRQRVCDMATPVKWTADGASLYVWFWEDRRLEILHLASGVRDTVLVLPETKDIGGVLSPDCDRFVYSVEVLTADIWLAERIEPD
jgi:serine/threonine protein kinase